MIPAASETSANFRRLSARLRGLVGKPKLIPYIEPLTDSVLTFADLAKAGGEFVVVDVETTGTDPKMADLVEVAAVRGEGLLGAGGDHLLALREAVLV